MNFFYLVLLGLETISSIKKCYKLKEIRKKKAHIIKGRSNLKIFCIDIG